jgi:hypothetical protein
MPAIIYMAFMDDFTHYATPYKPSGFWQRAKLASMYGAFLLFCVLHLLDALTGRDYMVVDEEKEKEEEEEEGDEKKTE